MLTGLVSFSQETKPVLVLKNKTQKFKTITQGEIIQFEYTLLNKGNADLVIYDVEVSCGCTTPNYSNAPIPPGQSIILKASFDSADKYGWQDRKIKITSNDTKSPHFLRFKGMVKEVKK
jgi:hypothetical protein